tara:strand:+ start:240 stop:677 length:438 start_codon:yes stop_codon:yes gene_type:complete
MDVNLICPAILLNIITLLLFLNSKTHDRILLFIMIIGQLILISGESIKNPDKIQISHIIFTTSLTFGSLYFNEIHNKIFVFVILLITIISRCILSECLFNMSNSYNEFEFEKSFDFINYDYLFLTSLMIISYKLLIKFDLKVLSE